MRAHPLLVAAGALALIGCSHQSYDQTAYQTPEQANWAQTKEAFSDAYDSVKTGARGVAREGRLVFERAGNGAVRVVDEAKTSAPAQAVSDTWITTKLKSEYAFDRDLKHNELHVTTTDGVVNLSGFVRDPMIAQKAIERALDTDGVVAVNSALAWPGSNQARIYAPGQPPVHQ